MSPLPLLLTVAGLSVAAGPSAANGLAYQDGERVRPGPRRAAVRRVVHWLGRCPLPIPVVDLVRMEAQPSSRVEMRDLAPWRGPYRPHPDDGSGGHQSRPTAFHLRTMLGRFKGWAAELESPIEALSSSAKGASPRVLACQLYAPSDRVDGHLCLRAITLSGRRGGVRERVRVDRSTPKAMSRGWAQDARGALRVYGDPLDHWVPVAGVVVLRAGPLFVALREALIRVFGGRESPRFRVYDGREPSPDSP